MQCTESWCDEKKVSRTLGASSSQCVFGHLVPVNASSVVACIHQTVKLHPYSFGARTSLGLGKASKVQEKAENILKGM